MNDVSDAEMQAIATLAAAILQRNTASTAVITDEDVKQAVLMADRGLTAAVHETRGSPKPR